MRTQITLYGEDVRQFEALLEAVGDCRDGDEPANAEVVEKEGEFSRWFFVLFGRLLGVGSALIRPRLRCTYTRTCTPRLGGNRRSRTGGAPGFSS